MFDEPVRSVMQRGKLLVAAPETSVSEAAEMMAKRNVGALVVVEDGRVAGIFTERDALFRVIARGLDAKTTKLAEVMTSSPETVEPEKPFGYALSVMHEKGFRHLPVIEDGKPIGIVSARIALDPDLEEFVSEAERRKKYHRQKS